MRICLVYDCLYPHTVGGAERWYANLAERLAADGHQVTYLTLRQWPRGTRARIDSRVDVVCAGPRLALYGGGRRRILPPLVFGAGVLWHLMRHGRRYDVVHTASFPYFSLLAAAVARGLGKYEIVVDWHEVWSRAYWRAYLGPVGGAIGLWVQERCARVRQRAFCFSQLHAARLRDEGLRGSVTVLRGEYEGPRERPVPRAPEPLVVFAGRLIPEKRAPVVVGAVAEAAASIPHLRGIVFGDGPDLMRVQEEIARLGPGASVSAPGFVDGDVVTETLAGALCLLLPSSREGYGLVVVEAAARGVPSIVVVGDDNAATELVEDGVNGFIAADAERSTLAAAIVRVHEAGASLRESTADWYAQHASELALETSLARVLAQYSTQTRSAYGVGSGGASARR